MEWCEAEDVRRLEVTIRVKAAAKDGSGPRYTKMEGAKRKQQFAGESTSSLRLATTAQQQSNISVLYIHTNHSPLASTWSVFLGIAGAGWICWTNSESALPDTRTRPQDTTRLRTATTDYDHDNTTCRHDELAGSE